MAWFQKIHVDYGEMSKATKKKYVKRETVESDYIPQNGQFIAKVSLQFSNLFQNYISSLFLIAFHKTSL